LIRVLIHTFSSCNVRVPINCVPSGILVN
jgi:hypothetical protein